VLADQISIAIENARLFASNQNALEAANRVYSDVSRAGWQQLMSNRQTEIGYISMAGDAILPATGQTGPEFVKAMRSGQVLLANDGTTLHVPIKIRDSVIGAIRLEKQKGSAWSVNDVATAKAISEQLGTSLESARLYNETNRKALREHLLGEISTKIGASSQRETILRTAVEELGRSIPGSEVIIQFENTDEQVGKHKNI
jgi:GAF domain-containing protein